MSPELIAILAVGVGLAQLETGQMQLRERPARPEGLLEGLREAVTGRRVPGDAA